MRWMIAAAAFAALPSAALAQDTAPIDHSQDLAWHNRQMAALAVLQPADGWSWMEGGVLWRRIEGNGGGVHPTVQDTVTVHYEGKLVDGTVFDSSFERDEPATFPLGRLIRAWQMTIPMAGVGDTIEIAVPSDLGYGPRGGGPIPGGATLFFKVKLIDVLGK